jgi:hypothetical protein
VNDNLKIHPGAAHTKTGSKKLWGELATPPQFASFWLIDFASELEAQANGRIDRGSIEESIRKTIRHLRPHDAGVSIEALGESVIGEEGNRIQLPAALRKGAG